LGLFGAAARSIATRLTAGYQGTNIIWAYSEPLPLNCREASPFCLDTKSTKKIKSAEMLLYALAFAAQTRKNLGLSPL